MIQIHYSVGLEGESLNYHGMIEFPRGNQEQVERNKEIILARMKKKMIADLERRNLNINKINSYEVYYFDYRNDREYVFFEWRKNE